MVVPKAQRLMLTGEKKKPSSTLRKREPNLKRGCWVEQERELLSEEGSFHKCKYS